MCCWAGFGPFLADHKQAMCGSGWRVRAVLVLVLVLVGVLGVVADVGVRGGGGGEGGGEDVQAARAEPEDPVANSRRGVRGLGKFETVNIEGPVDVQYLRSLVGWQYVACASVACVSAACLLVIFCRFVWGFVCGDHGLKGD